jgi:threonine/homoserine/homoserine lactone efflux protein
MPDTASLATFVGAALVVLLIPGPGVIYIVTRSLGQGHRAGLTSVLGLSAGALVHVAAATAGLSAILMTSATAFTIVKFLGAGYLIYLGVRTLLSRGQAAGVEAAAPSSLRRLFAEGVWVSVLNPKIAIFFLAFLPQFVDPATGSATMQILGLGLLYVALALITDSGYALLAGGIGHIIQGRVRHSRWPRYASGLSYIGLGISAAIRP